MTRVCCRCKATIGEKCPKCGADAQRDLLPEVVYHCTNPSCGILTFLGGCGGVTHTYCERCFAQVMDAANQGRLHVVTPEEEARLALDPGAVLDPRD